MHWKFIMEDHHWSLIYTHTHRLQITDYWGHAKIRDLHQIYLSINLNPASFWQVNNLNMACQPFLCVLTYEWRPQWRENNHVNDLTGQKRGQFHRKPAGNVLRSPFRDPRSDCWSLWNISGSRIPRFLSYMLAAISHDQLAPVCER